MSAGPFWSRVDRGDILACWLWRGGRDDFGYGQTKRKGKSIRTHRLAWILTHGTIPEGMQVHHKCDVPTCVNPSHLKLGTQQENMRDKVDRNRQAKGLRNGSHTRPDRRPRGARVGGAKLQELDVLFIRHWLTLGHEGIVLANEFGVTNANISAIRNGNTWAHL